MPRYTVQGPSGKTYTIEGPDGASADQLGEFILSQNQDERVAATRAQMAKEHNPTNDMSGWDRVKAGVGQGVTELARGAGQWVGAVNRDDVAESRKLDAPLMDTKAGAVGSFVGKAAPIAAVPMLAPAAASVGGAAVLGGVAGAFEPSTSAGETLRNIGLGSVFGAAGQKGGNMIADVLSKRAANKAAQFAQQKTANAQTVQAARDASAAGYVIPPSDVQPQGALMEALGGLSGKIKTAQTASAKNQGVTDNLAKKSVGLTPDDALTVDALKDIRAQAGAAYDQFRTVGTVPADAAYNAALDGVEKTMRGAVRSFPGLKDDAVSGLVEKMRQPAFDAGDAIDATKVLRESAEAAYAKGDKQLGKAYRTISGALEDALERHLQSTAPEAVQQFRDARKLIAKTYTVEAAMNKETGQVSAQKLAATLDRGKPLADELLTAARAGAAFPKATQALKETPKQLSPLDFGAAGLGLVGSGGNPLAALGLLARPAAREALLSSPIQQLALRNIAAPKDRIAALASNPIARLLYGVGGATAAVNMGK